MGFAIFFSPMPAPKSNASVQQRNHLSFRRPVRYFSRSEASPAGYDPRVYRCPQLLERTDLPLNGLVHERRDRLACLDDISRQHPPGFRAEVSRIMRGPRGDQESIPWAQYYGGTSLYPHLDLACDDVADLFSRMNVPPGLDSRRDQRLHLHHLTTWNR